MTITLNIHNEQLFDKILWLLNLFKNDGLEIIDINESISKQSTTLIKTYAKSHNLDIPDSLIGSTALVLNAPLFTSNLRGMAMFQN